MSKFLATAAEIIGGVALIATGIGAGASVGLFGSVVAGSSLAGTLATVATIAKVAGFAAAALAATSALTAKRISSASPGQWSANPDAGMDIVIGDAFNSGNIVYRQAYGDKNIYQTEVTHWSIGPVSSIDQLYVDNIARDVVGTVVQMPDEGKFHEARQLGLCPEPTNLTVGPIAPWHWDADCKLSGKAATICTFEYDSKSSNPFTSIPSCGWRGKGVLCYDPRKDDTYPGGAGAQRANDQTTWAWSDNPYVAGLTWCLGWWQNGKLVAGAGLAITGIVVADFVEGANVADANGWKVGGTKSTADDHWDVLKDILQAGGGQPLRLGALLGCVVSTPRVSLATIGRDDLAQGDISIVAMQARRDRINAIAARYRAELKTTITGTVSGQTRLYTSTTWADVSAAPIVVDAYVAADGRQRRKEVLYPLVQCFDGEQPTQVAQLARYDIEDAREFGPITLPLKIRWMGYKPGDVVTVDLPEVGLVNQEVMILTRSLEASTGVVTITARSETAAKHAFALGQTTTAPTSPGLPFNGWSYDVPGLAELQDAALQTAIATSFPIGLTITAGPDGTVTISDHTRRYTDGHADVAVTGATIATGLSAGTFRAIGYDDPDRDGGAVDYQLFADDIDARVSPTNPGRHYVGYVTIPTAGSPAADGGGASPPGGNCVTDDTPVMMADGSEKPAGQIVVGDKLWTRHEATLEWGVYPVEAVQIVATADVWQATIGGMTLRATGDHLVYTGAWVAMRDIGKLLTTAATVAGAPPTPLAANVVKMTVTSAHTYVSNGILSHNIKQNQQLQ